MPVRILLLFLLVAAPAASAAAVQVAAPTRLAVFEGEPFDVRLTAAGGVPPYTFELQAAAPVWLHLESDGTLWADAPEFGSSRVTICATDSRNERGCAITRLEVNRIEPLEIARKLPIGLVLQPYDALVSVRGGQPPYEMETGGGLPDGITVEVRDTGFLVSGVSDVSGRFPIRFHVVDSAGTTIEVTLDLLILGSFSDIVVSTSLPDGSVGRPYRAQARSTLTDARWTLLPDGLPPPGLELSESGVLEGVPTKAGRFTLYVQVEGADWIAQGDLRLRILEDAGPATGGSGGDPGAAGASGAGGSTGGTGATDPAGGTGGASDPARPRAIPLEGCECSSAGGSSLPLLLLLLLARRRR